MIKELANEFVKNFKIMFRNWTSISLLIVAPLVFILLVGYAFSSEDVRGLRIGVISAKSIDIAPLAYNVSTYAELVKYDYLEECISDMALQKTHICIALDGIKLSPETMAGDIGDVPTGKVIYYYDNTRKKISLALVKNMQDFFGLKSEEISIQSTEAIIENIQNLVSFINDRRSEIRDLRNESLALKQKLLERKQKLETLRSDFMPSYLELKDLQETLHNYTGQMDAANNNLTYQIEVTIAVLKQIRNITDNATIEFSTNITPNLTNESVAPLTNTTNKHDELNFLINKLELQLKDVSNLTNTTTSKVHETVAVIDESVGQIDTIKEFLDTEIKLNDEFILKIDQSVVRIDEISTQLDAKMAQLARINPSLAEKLIRPIEYKYNVLLTDAKNIQISFPMVLVMITMFIALMFANISTLQEINNKAYLRNIIAPVDDLIYTLGMFLTSLIIVFLQVCVLFIVAQTRLGVMITPVLWQICIVSLMLISVFILVGMIFAYLFKTVQSSVLITTFSALIFFLFSNSISVIEAMPRMAAIVSRYNPLVVGEYLVKEIVLFHTSLIVLMPQIFLLVSYVVVLSILLLFLSKRRNRMRGA